MKGGPAGFEGFVEDEVGDADTPAPPVGDASAAVAVAAGVFAVIVRRFLMRKKQGGQHVTLLKVIAPTVW